MVAHNDEPRFVLIPNSTPPPPHSPTESPQTSAHQQPSRLPSPKSHKVPSLEIISHTTAGSSQGTIVASSTLVSRALGTPIESEPPTPDITVPPTETFVTEKAAKMGKPGPRKKGTASAARKSAGGGPKRSRPGTKSSGNTSRARKSATTGLKSAKGELFLDLGTASATDSDNGPYCICRGPDDHRWMIQCEACEDWFHGECVDISKTLGESLVDKFVCPNCSVGPGEKGVTTRYKRTCSLPGCLQPARIYAPEPGPDGKAVPMLDARMRSVFCGQEHCDAWWEDVLGRMPTGEGTGGGGPAVEGLLGSEEHMVREQMMALLAGSMGDVDSGGHWKMTKAPFSRPIKFGTGGGDKIEDKHVTAAEDDDDVVLREEERTILASSRSERHDLGEQTAMCQNMLRLLDFAAERRRAAVAGKFFAEDTCGYDSRLDTVGVQAAFTAWLRSPAGEAVFRTGKLEDPEAGNITVVDIGDDGDVKMGGVDDGEGAGTENGAEKDDQRTAMTRGMCDRRRCKPHAGWHGMLVRATRRRIKDNAARASELLENEEFLKDAAAERAQRLTREHNWAEIVA